MVLKAGLAAVVVLTACVHGTPPTRLPRQERVAVAYVVDQARTREVADVPDSVVREVDDVLTPRNLAPRKVPYSDVAVSYTVRRTTEHRLAQLAEFADGARVLLLVELKVSFYSHLNGRWRWDVATKVTMATRDALDEAVSAEHDIATFLDYEHQREQDALARAGPEIAARVARLADDFLGALQAEPPPAAQPEHVPEPPPEPVPETPRPGAPEPPPPAVPGTQPVVPQNPAPGAPEPGADASDAIYFLLVDRFANGDPRNDGAIDLADPAAFHGGDLQGVIDRLDELKDLGIRTVWLSPVFRMRTEKFFGHGAFHGYWLLDPNAVEPRFGDEATLARLSSELHRRGMRLMLDLVVNHVAPDAPLARQRPGWFHHEGPITNFDDPAQLVTHDVHGLPDLAQENAEVHAWLRDAAFRWIDRVHPDGFRLDAVKHVPMAFWARFNSEIRARAGPGFTLLGEDLDGNPAHLARTLRDGHFSSLFDFPLHFALVDVFCRDASAERLAAALTATRSIGPDDALVTLADNHDLPRITTACGSDLDRVRAALSFLLAMRGAPAIQYGTEVALEGEREPDNRGDLWVGRAPPRPPVLRDAIRGGLALRRAHPSLRRGTTRFVAVRPDLLVIERLAADETALVVVNRARAPAVVDVPGPLRRGLRSATGQTVAGGRLQVAPGTVWIGFGPALPVVPVRPVEVVVRARGVRLTPGESLVLVGADPALGAWDPARGAGPFVPAAGGTLSATLTLPADSVHDCKLVVRSLEGAARWERRDNRALFLPAGGARRTVEMTWASP